KGNYPGGRPSVWMKGRDGTQEALITLDPESFFVPPYVGHKGWIGAWMDRPRIKWSMLEDLIAESHGLVGTKQKRRARRCPKKLVSGTIFFEGRIDCPRARKKWCLTPIFSVTNFPVRRG